MREFHFSSPRPLFRLDFLPVRCDACGETFCIEHYSYTLHSCESGLRKDVQVPVCPLCMEPVPTSKDDSPDMTVGRHIDQFCKSESRKIYTNRCTMRGCKKKELMPVICSQCKRNFCLRHRHTTDHSCDPQNAIRDQRANAAMARMSQKSQATRQTSSSNNQQHAQAIQGSMTEDEALAHAIALSMQQQTTTSNPVTVGGGKDKCALS